MVTNKVLIPFVTWLSSMGHCYHPSLVYNLVGGCEHKNDMICCKILKVIPVSAWETEGKAGPAAGRPVTQVAWRSLQERGGSVRTVIGRKGSSRDMWERGTIRTDWWTKCLFCGKEWNPDKDVLFA